MRRHFLSAFFCLATAAPLAAQVTETPVPFDSAGRIASINEPLANRLGLAPPAWPVTGTFVEAKLFRTGDSSYVIVVQQAGGANARYPLTPGQLSELRIQLTAATARVGQVVAEDAASLVAEPARRPFIRNQMFLGFLMYGPAVSSLMDDETASPAGYLLTVGGTFFVVSEFAKTHPISKAQNSMATDGALRWAIIGASVLNAGGADLDDKGGALVELAGGIGGSIIGYQAGKSLTNSEAQAAMTGSTLLAGATVGTIGVSGAYEGDGSGRTASAALAAGGIAGYLLGPRYPRQASYTVTAGDIQLVRLGAYLGTAALITPLVGNTEPDHHLAWGMATAGWIGGALLTDHIAARPFNHSESDARMIELGALGGGLMAVAFPVLAHADDGRAYLGFASAGAIGGAIIAQHMMEPPRQGQVPLTTSDRGGERRWNVDFNPSAAAMALAGQRGNHTLLHITF